MCTTGKFFLTMQWFNYTALVILLFFSHWAFASSLSFTSADELLQYAVQSPLEAKKWLDQNSPTSFAQLQTLTASLQLLSNDEYHVQIGNEKHVRVIPTSKHAMPGKSISSISMTGYMIKNSELFLLFSERLVLPRQSPLASVGVYAL